MAAPGSPRQRDSSHPVYPWFGAKGLVRYPLHWQVYLNFPFSHPRYRQRPLFSSASDDTTFLLFPLSNFPSPSSLSPPTPTFSPPAPVSATSPLLRPLSGELFSCTRNGRGGRRITVADERDR